MNRRRQANRTRPLYQATALSPDDYPGCCSARDPGPWCVSGQRVGAVVRSADYGLKATCPDGGARDNLGAEHADPGRPGRLPSQHHRSHRRAGEAVLTVAAATPAWP